jgi:hypothetical protein
LSDLGGLHVRPEVWNFAVQHTCCSEQPVVPSQATTIRFSHIPAALAGRGNVRPTASPCSTPCAWCAMIPRNLAEMRGTLATGCMNHPEWSLSLVVDPRRYELRIWRRGRLRRLQIFPRYKAKGVCAFQAAATRTMRRLAVGANPVALAEHTSVRRAARWGSLHLLKPSSRRLREVPQPAPRRRWSGRTPFGDERCRRAWTTGPRCSCRRRRPS